MSGLQAQGRFLRIVGLKPGSSYGLFSIWEIEFPEPHVAAVLQERLRTAEERRKETWRQVVADLGRQGVEEIVFAVRKIVPEHWYANFGYYASDGGQSYFGNSNTLYRDAGRLCRLNLASGQVTTLVDDPKGGVGDPQVHYDGQKILLSYRPGAERYR